MANALTQVLLFLISIVFSLYVWALLLRFLLQWVKADFYNPLCQFIARLTNPLVLPLRYLVPGLFGLDMASLVAAVIVLGVEIALLNLLIHSVLPWPAFLLVVVIRLAESILNLYFFSILVRALLSFSPSSIYNPVFLALVQLTEPLLRPIRKVIKPFHGFDLSALILMVLIQVMLVFIGALV